VRRTVGTIYKRNQTYWIKYYCGGKPFYESTGSTKETDAKRLLKRREGEISDGKLPGIYFDKVRFDELADDFLADYRVNQRKSLERAELSVGHLKRFFGGQRAIQVTTPGIHAYVETRVKKGAANASINRELAALKRMFNLAAQQTPPKVDKVPHIPMLKENNTRKGFFEHGDFVALRDALPSHLKGFVTFAYKRGWRISEIANLTWPQVDRAQGIVRLDAGETKNDEARTVYLDEELKEIFAAQWERRKKSGNLLPYVFLNKEETDRVKRFDKTWASACKKAKISKRLFHDLRRTAVRNMVRAGIPERVAMMVSGHKTRNVFERYNIVSDTDLKMASDKQAAYLDAQMVTKTVTIRDFPTKKGSSEIAEAPIQSGWAVRESNTRPTD
jgi:integrase